MKKKGFTLIELLVVIAIIAMLLAILMPALNKVKKIAQRVICGTNLKGLGNAQMVYANDYDDEYVVQGGGWGPAAGPAWTTDNSTTGWQKSYQQMAPAQRSSVTVGASLYLLVREADVSPKSFVCPSGGEQEFGGKNDGNGGVPWDIVDLYDFGHPTGSLEKAGPAKCVSYAYHNPYMAATPDAQATGAKARYVATGSRTASFAVMADKNPFFDDKLYKGEVTAENYIDRVTLLGGPTKVSGDWTTGSTAATPLLKWEKDCANAQPHGREGQNVLFADGHSAYETRTDISTRNDNIYTRFEQAGGTDQRIWRRGQFSKVRNEFYALGTDDSCLVNDHISALEQPNP